MTGRPVTPNTAHHCWTLNRIRAAHAAYVEGARSPIVNEGERLYRRAQKRAQRANAREAA